MLDTQRNSRISRLIIVVLDGAGVGALPDAAEYGDVGSNTFANTARALGGLQLPNLESLGLGNLADIQGVPPMASCSAAYGVMHELSKGKDTITGHWEMMGIVTERPFPTYPHGFPPEVISEFEQAIGRTALGNVVVAQKGEALRAGDVPVRIELPNWATFSLAPAPAPAGTPAA